MIIKIGNKLGQALMIRTSQTTSSNTWNYQKFPRYHGKLTKTILQGTYGLMLNNKTKICIINNIL